MPRKAEEIGTDVPEQLRFLDAFAAGLHSTEERAQTHVEEGTREIS